MFSVRRGWNTQRNSHGFGLEGRDELRFTLNIDVPVAAMLDTDNPRIAVRDAIVEALSREAGNPLGLYGIMDAMMDPWPAPRDGLGFKKMGI